MSEIIKTSPKRVLPQYYSPQVHESDPFIDLFLFIVFLWVLMVGKIENLMVDGHGSGKLKKDLKMMVLCKDWHQNVNPMWYMH